MYVHSPSDPMQVRAPGELMQPGQCISCGSGNKEWYLDFGIFLDYEGQVYFCNDCITHAAEVIGCLLPDESRHLQTQAEQLAEALQITKDELEKANERLAAFDLAIGNFVGSGSLVFTGHVDSGGEVPPEATEGSASGEPVPAKPVKVSRRSNPEQPELRNSAADTDKPGGLDL